jgi:ActR/RegA family two-component response regulator
MNSKPQCLVVHGDRDFLGQLERFFRATQPDYEVVTSSNSVEALAQVRENSPALIVIGYLLRQIDGLHFISSVRGFDTEVPIFMISDVPVEVAALSRGATAFFDTPSCLSDLDAEISALRESERMVAA